MNEQRSLRAFDVTQVQRAFARTMGVQLKERPVGRMLPARELLPPEGAVSGSFAVYIFKSKAPDNGTYAKPWSYGYPEISSPPGRRDLTGRAERANVVVKWFPDADEPTPEIEATWKRVARTLDDLT